MTPKIKKLLYATDLSANSTYAFGYAINLAIKHNARIAILHVFEPLSPTTQNLMTSYLSIDKSQEILAEKITDSIERIRKRIKLFCNRELESYPEIADRIESIKVYEGFPAEEIIREAKALNCDAIVMGNHGKGILKQTFLGSTTKKVLRRTRIPVLIIPLPKGETDLSLHYI